VRLLTRIRLIVGLIPAAFSVSARRNLEDTSADRVYLSARKTVLIRLDGLVERLLSALGAGAVVGNTVGWACLSDDRLQIGAHLIHRRTSHEGYLRRLRVGWHRGKKRGLLRARGNDQRGKKQIQQNACSLCHSSSPAFSGGDPFTTRLHLHKGPPISRQVANSGKTTQTTTPRFPRVSSYGGGFRVVEADSACEEAVNSGRTVVVDGLVVGETGRNGGSDADRGFPPRVAGGSRSTLCRFRARRTPTREARVPVIQRERPASLPTSTHRP